MNSKITKFDVFLYFADQLDRARRLELEAACATNTQVRQWFDDLTPTQAELDAAPVPTIATDTPEYRRIAAQTYLSMSRESEPDMWEEFARIFRETPEGPIRTTKSLLASGAARGLSRVEDNTLVGNLGCTSSQDTSPPLPDVPDYEVITDTTIFLSRSDAEVPFALVRVIAARNGIPITSIVRVMEFDERNRTWKREIPKTAIFKEEVPTGKIEYYFAFGVDKESRTWFSRDQVAEILEEIPHEYTEERRRVQTLLDQL